MEQIEHLKHAKNYNVGRNLLFLEVKAVKGLRILKKSNKMQRC